MPAAAESVLSLAVTRSPRLAVLAAAGGLAAL